MVTKEIQNIYLIFEGAKKFPKIKVYEDKMVMNCKNQIDLLFENLREQYNDMLTIKLDTITKGIFDATYFDQKLEID